MSWIDWLVLVIALVGIIAYGMFKSEHTKNLEGYFLGDRSMPWWIVLISIMGTQASAVTFLSAPGQAYTDGMRFVQYYFGLPLAMLVVSFVFVPIFSRLKVVTAYEYLENRFNLNTRVFTAFLFLLSRGLSTGISIYAPAIIVSSILGWNIYITNVVVGGLLIIYTVTGGSKAVAVTQKVQFGIIILGMVIAAYFAIHLIPGHSFQDALDTGKLLGKMNVITTGFTEEGFNWKDKYNIWSGVIGGFFLSLSYFGTDQSQVGRYLAAKNDKESKTGLLLNGLVKVPMQYLILLVGILVLAFYQNKPSPIFFDSKVVAKAQQTEFAPKLNALEANFNALNVQQLEWQRTNDNGIHDTIIVHNYASMESLRKEYKAVLKEALPMADVNDTNYIFLYFITRHLPKGMVGLLIAVIILAAWGSIAAALNSLSSTTLVDIHQKVINKKLSEAQSYKLSWWYTFFWGVFCIVVAMFATNMGSLIEAVNVLGSLFYGVILGIFLVAFFIKFIRGNAVLIAAIVSECLVILVYKLDIVSFLWLNVIGVIFLIVIALIVQLVLNGKKQ